MTSFKRTKPQLNDSDVDLINDMPLKVNRFLGAIYYLNDYSKKCFLIDIVYQI